MSYRLSYRMPKHNDLLVVLESDLFWYRSYASNNWSQYKMVAKLFLPVPAPNSVCFVYGSNSINPSASWIPVGGWSAVI